MPTFLKNPYLCTVYLFIILILVSIIWRNLITSGLLLCYTGFLPFINTILWISVSNTGEKIRERLKVWHWVMILPWFAFAYSLFAQKWAGNLLNEIFYVDPNLFGVTYLFLSVFLAPIGLLYKQGLIEKVFLLFFVTAILFITILPLALLTRIPFKRIAKLFVLFQLGVMGISFFLTMVGNIPKQINNITTQFALTTDFNEHHMCSNSWATSAKGVIFLGGNKVLAYFPNNERGNQFKIKTCHTDMSF